MDIHFSAPQKDTKWWQFAIDVGQEIDPQTGKTII